MESEPGVRLQMPPMSTPMRQANPAHVAADATHTNHCECIVSAKWNRNEFPREYSTYHGARVLCPQRGPNAAQHKQQRERGQQESGDEKRVDGGLRREAKVSDAVVVARGRWRVARIVGRWPLLFEREH